MASRRGQVGGVESPFGSDLGFHAGDAEVAVDPVHEAQVIGLPEGSLEQVGPIEAEVGPRQRHGGPRVGSGGARIGPAPGGPLPPGGDGGIDLAVDPRHETVGKSKNEGE